MPTKKPLVIVDPGHGGADPGAVGFGGARESDLNLSLAGHFLDAALYGGTFDAVLLRTKDVFLSLAERAARANALQPDAVLSFHCNACASPQARGFEVWTTRGQTEADWLATYIYAALDVGLPYPGRGDYDDGDPDKESDFYILRNTKAPAVLVEFGFVTNPDDLDYLLKDENRRFISTLVHNAVLNRLLGVVEYHEV